MSKMFIADVLRESAGLSRVAVSDAAGAVIGSIVTELKREERFNVPGFGTFVVVKRKALPARNPRTGEPVKVKAGKTVRFRASPALRRAV